MIRQHNRDFRIGIVCLLAVLQIPLGIPVAAEEMQLDVGTSTTTIAPLPPVPTVMQIDENSPAEATLDKPLSLMGEVLLEAVCSSWIPADFALKVFPDLSMAHIQRTCPQAIGQG
jgi:hypothetical protein